VFDDIGRMGDHTGNDDLALRQLMILPHTPLVLVTHVGGFEGVSTGIDLQYLVDDGFEGNVGRMRTMPAPQQTWNLTCSSGMPLSA
jgi:hypothetical protein